MYVQLLDVETATLYKYMDTKGSCTEFILRYTVLECMHLYRQARIQDVLRGAEVYKSRRPLIQLNIPIQGRQLWGIASREIVLLFLFAQRAPVPPPLDPPLHVCMDILYEAFGLLKYNKVHKQTKGVWSYNERKENMF